MGDPDGGCGRSRRDAVAVGPSVRTSTSTSPGIPAAPTRTSGLANPDHPVPPSPGRAPPGSRVQCCAGAPTANRGAPTSSGRGPVAPYRRSEASLHAATLRGARAAPGATGTLADPDPSAVGTPDQDRPYGRASTGLNSLIRAGTRCRTPTSLHGSTRAGTHRRASTRLHIPTQAGARRRAYAGYHPRFAGSPSCCRRCHTSSAGSRARCRRCFVACPASYRGARPRRYRPYGAARASDCSNRVRTHPSSLGATSPVLTQATDPARAVDPADRPTARRAPRPLRPGRSPATSQPARRSSRPAHGASPAGEPSRVASRRGHITSQGA
jgi:hypothetical protein